MQRANHDSEIYREPLLDSTLSRRGRQEKETMRLNRYHFGRSDNFGQFCLFGSL